MGATITQHQPGSFTVEMDFDGAVPSANWSQEFLLISDAHIDNAHADRQMFDRHMRQCRERGAQWISNGDFLCCMQGTWDGAPVRPWQPRDSHQAPARNGHERAPG
jgi:predicted YcjX-like family ATPase